jgi:phage-related protein
MRIVHFKQPSGKEPVREYILSLTKSEAAKVTTALEDIEKNGLDGTVVILKPIEGKLWEIKLPVQRIFYVIISGPTMVLLHAFKKEGQKTPQKEKKLAKQRMNLVLRGQHD